MSTDDNAPTARQDCYFLARKHGGRIETRGQASAEFGHRLASRAHPVDDGVFAGWHWDGARLVANNDRYGFYPLFWSRLRDGDGMCISPSLVTLVEQGVPADLDIEALSVFFRLGFFVGDDTPFAAIRTLPPNATFEWEDGQLTCRGRYPSVPGTSDLSRDASIDRYIALFAQAMARRAPKSDAFAVPISGGRDSRHILLELHRMGCTPAACVSAMDNPPDPNQDPPVAGMLCAALGYRQVIVDQELSLFAAQMRKNPATHFCAAEHAWYLALADHLNGRFEHVYDGIAGDVLSAGLWLAPELDAVFRSRSSIAAATAVLRTAGSAEAMLAHLLKGPLRQAASLALARERLGREIERHLASPNPVTSFYFWNRTRRTVALPPFALLRDIPDVYAPYLDHDLFDFLVTLPADMLMDHAFHTDTIARAYPDFADIPYADKQAPQTDASGVRARFAAEVTRRFLLRRPSRLMKNSLPRARMLVHALSAGRIGPWIPPLILYLDQIEAIAYGRYGWQDRDS